MSINNSRPCEKLDKFNRCLHVLDVIYALSKWAKVKLDFPKLHSDNAAKTRYNLKKKNKTQWHLANTEDSQITFFV